MKYAIAYNGIINLSETYDSREKAQREIEEQVRDACREDARDGAYSAKREASYWRALSVVAL